MKKFKKISLDKFELKGKATLISVDNTKNITGGILIGTDDVCRS